VRSRTAFHVLFMFAVAALGAVVFVVGIVDCLDCSARGGAYVKGAVWYECVERAK
jgi:hypothetical protein